MASDSQARELCVQAKACLRNRDLAEAQRLFEQAVQIHDTSVEANEGLGLVHFATRNYDKAIEYFTRVTRLAPTKASAYINLGAVYNRLGEFNQAVEWLRRGIQRDRRSSEAYYNLGIAQRGLNQFSMAVSAYREALRLQPDLAEAHQNLANIYLEMKSPQQAIAHYQKALELRPNLDRARRGLAKAQAELLRAKEQASPFGRLVGDAAASPPAQPSPAITMREMTHRERFEDRREVQRCCTEIARLTTALVNGLKNRLEPSLLQLDRAVTQSGTAPRTLLRAHEVYQAALSDTNSLQEALRRKVLELRAHEELIHAPRLDVEG